MWKGERNVAFFNGLVVPLVYRIYPAGPSGTVFINQNVPLVIVFT